MTLKRGLPLIEFKFWGELNGPFGVEAGNKTQGWSQKAGVGELSVFFCLIANTRIPQKVVQNKNFCHISFFYYFHIYYFTNFVKVFFLEVKKGY